MPRLGAGPVAGGLDGHEDAFGAAGGHVASGLGMAEEVRRHGDDLGLELLEALEGGGAEAVGVEGGGVGLLEDLRDVVAGEVDEGEDLAAAPVGVAGDGFVEAGGEVFTGGALFGELHWGLLGAGWGR